MQGSRGSVQWEKILLGYLIRYVVPALRGFSTSKHYFVLEIIPIRGLKGGLPPLASSKKRRMREEKKKEGRNGGKSKEERSNLVIFHDEIKVF